MSDKSNHVKPAAVAGLFYPGEAQTLAETVDSLLGSVQGRGPAPKALIVPHAGYVYSGPIAASAYAQWAPIKDTIKRVVILGPTHRVGIAGVALPAADAVATPLGEVHLDTTDCDDLPRRADVHAQEHSLEVHYPFLQRLVPHAQITPIAVGDASPRLVADLLQRLWGDEHTRIVISSDLSHFLPYAEAQQLDALTAQAITRGETIAPEQACGAYAVNGLTALMPSLRLRIDTLDLRNSADTQGNRGRVVGYGAFAVHESVS